MSSSPAIPAVHDWDANQCDVIRAAATARLLVDSGPGTGKTAVACSRVAWLITKQHVSPANIILISFTRTAVAELRQRLAAYIGDERRAAAVRIATLDSEAWRLNQGFQGDEASLLGGYDANIESVSALIRAGHDEVEEYLHRFRHLIVDEAQDLTGVRAVLVMEFMRHVSAGCGITVFADPGQAIYGFTVEEGSGHLGEQTLLAMLKGADDITLQPCRLKKIYRTESPQLLRVFTDTRELLEREDLAGHEELRQALHREASGTPPEAAELSGRTDHLLLFRYRRDVVRLSQDLCEQGIAHRLRMSKAPLPVHAWIGWLLAPLRLRFIDQKGIASLWADREMGTLFPEVDPGPAFSLLWSLAPGEANRIDLGRLRHVLARTRPPAEVCSSECGHGGPVIGTIHASKGREADEVVLCLPALPNKDDDIAEETRVLYVGATRPRKRLVVHDGPKTEAYALDSGRLWCMRQFPGFRPFRAATVELGLNGDIDPLAAVQEPLATNGDDAAEVQRLLAQAARSLPTVVAHCKSDWNYSSYRLELENHPGKWIGQFSTRVSDDLREIMFWFGKHSKTKVLTPWKIDRLHLFSVRTVAVTDDDPARTLLHEPYRSSGFMLAPVVIGYPLAFFKKRK